METILVTGASGFVGSFIVDEALQRGYEVWAAVRSSSSRKYLQHPDIHFLELDFAHSDKLHRQLSAHKEAHAKFDYIVHCAGVTKCKHSAEFDQVNYLQTKEFVNTLCELDMRPKQFIHISTLSIFGPLHEDDYAPLTEKDIPAPNTAYGLSKLKAERYLQSIPNFPYVIFRPTGVYGPRERDYFLMAKSIKQHLDLAVGFRRQDLTFVYVKDIAQAVFLSIDKKVVRRAYALTDGEVYSSRTFSDLIRKELGNPFLLRITAPLFLLKLISYVAGFAAGLLGTTSTLNPDKYKIMKQRNWRCDITPARKELGYRPQYQLERGVKEAMDWYKEAGWL